MDQVCGIYKITHLADGGCYIGQSVNIYNRWKQHTQSLDRVTDLGSESLLRRAFIKHGMLKQISKPCVYKGFKFEVLQECSQTDLTKCESEWIKKLIPEYNIQQTPPSPDKIWSRPPSLEKTCFVQYHDFNKCMHMPFDNIDVDWHYDCPGYVNTSKNTCQGLKGKKVYLIVGLKQKKSSTKDYFLYGYTYVEAVEYVERSKDYGVDGVYFYCKTPIYLNAIPGFKDFFKNTMGNGAFGLQNVVNDPFHEFLEQESLYSLPENMNCNYIEWLHEFETKYLEDESLKLTTKTEKGLSWNLFEKISKHTCELRRRAYIPIDNYLDDVFELFKLYQQKNPKITVIRSLLNTSSAEFVKVLPLVKHVIVYDEKSDVEKLLDELRTFENVSLICQHPSRQEGKLVPQKATSVIVTKFGIFREGAKVFHKDFGRGVVTGFDAWGSMVIVRFEKSQKEIIVAPKSLKK